MFPTYVDEEDGDKESMPPSAQHVRSSQSSQQSNVRRGRGRFVYDSALIYEFKSVPLTTKDESEWYGPWDSLLHRLFPAEDGFQVAPQHQFANVLGGPEWTVYFLVKYRAHIIGCIIEIKTLDHYQSHKKRIKAYNQLSDRLEMCLDDSIQRDVKAIFGLSCLGPRFMIMRLDTRTQVLEPRLQEEFRTTDIGRVAPKEWWSHQALRRQGCIHLHALAARVRGSINKRLKLAIPEPITLESLPNDASDVDIAWETVDSEDDAA